MSSRCIAVAGKGKVDQVDRYFYIHTGRALTVQGEDSFVAFCVTAVNLRASLDEEHNEKTSDRTAAYLAKGQAERLQSGLFFARVYDTMVDAMKDPDVAYLLRQTDAVFAEKILGAAK